MTHLCVPIFVASLDQARRDAVLAAEHGADLIEYRIDTFTDEEPLRQLLNASPKPFILTCRASSEGGQSDLTGEQRVEVVRTPGVDRAHYVDLELETLKKVPPPNLGG